MSVERCYQNLANAVVERAAEDYIRALCSEKSDAIKSIEKFFKGPLITLYTTLDGRALMHGIQNMVVEYNYDLKKINKARVKTRWYQDNSSM